MNPRRLAVVVASSLAPFFPVASNGAEVPILDDFRAALEIPSDAASRVYRMDLDVTGDGKPEIFLGTSYLAGAYGRSWAVYTPLDGGKYRRLGILVFHYEAFYYSVPDSRFVVYVRISAQSGGFTKFHVTTSGFEELAEPYDPAEERAKIDAWKQGGRPRLYWVDLSELLGSASPVWRDSETGKSQPSLGRLDEIVIQSSTSPSP